MNLRRLLLVVPLLLSFVAIDASAKLWKNTYVSFELPRNWSCNRDGTEWVCVMNPRPGQKSRHHAIIILTAKEVGPADSFQTYSAYLKAPRTIPSKSGQPTRSKVLHVRERRISNTPWVDGMHLGSEVSTYYTRYLATIKDGLAILVTFSAHKQHYTRYSNDFLRAINSLRVVAPKNILSQRPNLAIRKSNESIGAPIGSHMPMDIGEDYPEEASGSKSDLLTKLLGLALLLGSVGFYLYSRQGKTKRRRKRRKTPRPPQA